MEHNFLTLIGPTGVGLAWLIGQAAVALAVWRYLARSLRPGPTVTGAAVAG